MPVVASQFNAYETYNEGLYRRQSCWNMNPAGVAGKTNGGNNVFGDLHYGGGNGIMKAMYKSHIFNVQNGDVGANSWQCTISAVIMLRHLHSFFDKYPLIRGCFFKLTLNLNQSVIQVACTGNGKALTCTSAIAFWVQPLLFAFASEGE